MSTDDKAMRERLRTKMRQCEDWMTECQILAFAQSELTRALQARDPAPGLADAEVWFRQVNTRCDDDGVANAALAVLSELDRLRAEVADLKARLYAEQYEADNLVGASHDEVLKLRAENLKWQSEHTALKLDYHNVEAEIARLARENAGMRKEKDQVCCNCNKQLRFGNRHYRINQVYCWCGIQMDAHCSCQPDLENSKAGVSPQVASTREPTP